MNKTVLTIATIFAIIWAFIRVFRDFMAEFSIKYNGLSPQEAKEYYKFSNILKRLGKGENYEEDKDNVSLSEMSKSEDRDN